MRGGYSSRCTSLIWHTWGEGGGEGEGVVREKSSGNEGSWEGRDTSNNVLPLQQLLYFKKKKK